MDVWRPLTGWSRDERGNVAVMFALMLPLIVGGAAFGVETTIWYQARLNLQNQADAAAFSAVLDKKAGRDSTVMTASATKAAADNGFATGSGTIVVNSPPQSGASGATAVEVILHTTSPRYFSALFTKTPVSLTARAVAKYITSGQACVLALNGTASGAATFSGSSSLTLNGCSVMANSTAPAAINMNGNAATLSAQCLYAVGGVSTNNHVSQTCGAAVTGVSPVADPFGGLPEPTDPTACKAVSSAALTPGNYCSGFDINANTTLAPGVYIISGGAFRLNGNKSLTGSGVTFYIKSDVAVTINGNFTIDVSAPTSGTYAGMLFFGARNNTNTQKFNGTATSHLTGNLYFADAPVEYSGNFSGLNGCTQIVADTVTWTGNTSINVNCSAYGMGTIPTTSTALLTE